LLRDLSKFITQTGLYRSKQLETTFHQFCEKPLHITFNRNYDINPELFFQLDEGARRGHDHKLFRKRFRLKLGNTRFPTELLIIGICCLQHY